jgi:hypothetical protein
MVGIIRYQPQGTKDRGKGARFDSVAGIAGRKFETVLAITDWKDGERMTVSSSTGLKLKASWLFEEFDDGTTDVTLVNEYETRGLPADGWAGPINGGEGHGAGAREAQATGRGRHQEGAGQEAHG